MVTCVHGPEILESKIKFTQPRTETFSLLCNYRVLGRELLPGEDPADLLPSDEQVLARVDGDEGGVVRVLHGESQSVDKICTLKIIRGGKINIHTK